MTVALSGDQTVTVTGVSVGGCENTATLTPQELSVTEVGTVALSDATDNIICYDDDPDNIEETLAATVSDGAVGYQWYSSLDGTNFSKIVGANTNEYNPGPLQQTIWFRRNIIVTQNGKICEQDGDELIKIEVIPEFDVNLTSNPAGSYCIDDVFEIVAAAGVNKEYEFFLNNVSIAAASADRDLNFIAKEARDIAADPVEVQNGDTIRIDVTEVGEGCVYQESVVISIDDSINASLISDAPSNFICDGQEVTFTAGLDEDYTYQFFVDETPALEAE